MAEGRPSERELEEALEHLKAARAAVARAYAADADRVEALQLLVAVANVVQQLETLPDLRRQPAE